MTVSDATRVVAPFRDLSREGRTTPTEPGSPATARVGGDYLRHLRRHRNLSPMSIVNIGSILRMAARYAAEDGGDLLTMTADEFEDFLDTRNLAAGSRRLYLAHLSMFYRWATKRALVADSEGSDQEFCAELAAAQKHDPRREFECKARSPG